MTHPYSIIMNRMMIENRNRPLVVGINGLACSGKTTMGRRLQRILGCTWIELDDYMIPRLEKKEKGITGNNPNATRLGKLRSDLLELRSERAVCKPVYDTSNGSVWQWEYAVPAPVILLTGVGCSFDGVRELLDVHVWLSVSEEDHVARRLERDVQTRGYTESQVLESIPGLMKEFTAHVEPVQGEADVVV